MSRYRLDRIICAAGRGVIMFCQIVPVVCLTLLIISIV